MKNALIVMVIIFSSIANADQKSGAILLADSVKCVVNIGSVFCESEDGDFEGGRESSARCQSTAVLKTIDGRLLTERFEGEGNVVDGLFSEFKALSQAKVQLKNSMSLVNSLPICN